MRIITATIQAITILISLSAIAEDKAPNEYQELDTLIRKIDIGLNDIRNIEILPSKDNKHLDVKISMIQTYIGKPELRRFAIDMSKIIEENEKLKN